MALTMGNVLPRTASVRLLETIVPDLQRTIHRTYAIQPRAQLATALRFLATGNFKRECGDIHGDHPCRDVWVQSKRDIIRLSRFYLLKKGANFFSHPIFLFFVFKISDILYVLFYTYIISLKVIKHVVFCGHLWLLLK